MNTTTDNAQGLPVLIQQLRGRAQFLRDKGRVKSPDLMEEAADALATQEVVGGKTADSPPQQDRATPWRSMESAPRDGTIVFGMLPDSNVTHAVFYGDKHRKQDGFRVCWRVAWDGCHLGEHSEPVAWMPIPVLAAAPAAPRSGHETALPATPESEQRERKERSDWSAEPVGHVRGIVSRDGERRFCAIEFTGANTLPYGTPLHTTPAASDGGLREAAAALADRWATREREIAAEMADDDDPREGHIMMGVLDSCARDLRNAVAVAPTPQASTPAAVAPEQVTDAELLEMSEAYAAPSRSAVLIFPERLKAAGNALLALRAAQQKGGGQ